MRIMSRAYRKVVRVVHQIICLHKARRMGLSFVEPNFLYWPRISSGDIVIDAGCGFEADFSVLMIDRYGASSFAVDPTQKHRSSLSILESKYPKQFTHLPLAVGSCEQELIFHESEFNESGSLFEGHTNIKSDKIISYKVRSVTIKSLLEMIGSENIAILKLDIEGAEYPLLSNIEGSDLNCVDQIFVEFHHNSVSDFGIADTHRIIDRINNFGFQSMSVDGDNYIFWRP
jgi:FkbM family methyltransferase